MIESIAAINQKIIESDEISSDVEKYLAAGKKVSAIDFGVSQYDEKTKWGDYKATQAQSTKGKLK